MQLAHITKVVHGVKVKRLLPSSQKGKERQLKRLNERFKGKQLSAVLYQRQNMEMKERGQTPTKNQLHTTGQAFTSADKVIKKIRKLEQN